MNEIIGIIASCFVLACFCFDNPKIIRILDAIGAALYVIYGLLIGSFSNVALNSVLIVIQVAKLIRLQKSKK